MDNNSKVPKLNDPGFMHKDYRLSELVEMLEERMDFTLIAIIGAFIFLFITYF